MHSGELSNVYSSPLLLGNANPVSDKGEDKGRKGKRNQVEVKRELTCLTCQVHILLKVRLREGGRAGGEERQWVRTIRHIRHISRGASLMSDWISNGYAVSNDSDALIWLYWKGYDLLPWWHFNSLSNSVSSMPSMNKNKKCCLKGIVWIRCFSIVY